MNKYFWNLLVIVAINFTAYGQLSGTIVDTGGSFTIERILKFGTEYDLIKPMVGDWEVQQRIWLKAGAEPITSPPFIVHRRMTGHFLEEVMEAKPGTDVTPFTRITYLNFNYANLQWEHIVLDTRYPVMMFETSHDGSIKNGKEITLYLPAFIIPPVWDKEIAGQLGKQRRTISLEGKDTNVIKQYWTIPGGREFLAIEYIYQRKKTN
jgi:Protein of unknown function (DUF1579)